MDSILSLLQFADGLFPAGAYAHSFLGLGILRSVERCEPMRQEWKIFFGRIWKAP